MKTLTVLLTIIVLALLGMGFYMNDKIERLEVKLASIDTLHVSKLYVDTLEPKVIDFKNQGYIANRLTVKKTYPGYEEYLNVHYNEINVIDASNQNIYSLDFISKRINSRPNNINHDK